MARVGAVTATVAVLWGWAAGQYPAILPGQATVADSVAPDPVLWAMIGAFGAALIVAIPALVYLLSLAQRGRLADGGVVEEGSTQAHLDRLIGGG
jgi:cytochrome d ubiquinol oxidase subunit II